MVLLIDIQIMFEENYWNTEGMLSYVSDSLVILKLEINVNTWFKVHKDSTLDLKIEFRHQ